MKYWLRGILRIYSEVIMTRSLCLLILLSLLTVSCEKNDYVNSFPAKVRFDVSYRLLEGKKITCIDFNEKGNAWIGSGTELFYHGGSELKSYNIGFPVMDLAVAPDQTVWIGTNGGGLGHLDGDKLTWYNMANAELPRDVVMNVEAAPDGNIWFASCAFRLGGLGIFNGKKFTFLTPENSPLNQNIIEDIEIDRDGNVYIATTGTVGRTNIYRITDNSWECLGNEEGTFYWIMSFTISPEGTIYLVEDFSLSSLWSQNKLFKFENDDWENIKTDENLQISFFSTIKADKRNYCWLTSSGEDDPALLVFNGHTWFSSPEGLFPDASIITSIETDNENNIWVGTWSNGIFILNQ